MGRRTADRSASNLLLSFWLPAVLYAAVVLAVGSLPNLHPPFSFSNSYKLIHVFEYLVLGLLLTRATRATWRAPVPAFGTRRQGWPILNENKRPDLAPVEQGVRVHEQIARSVAPRLNAVIRHIIPTQQAMTQTQTLRGHGRQQCYGTTKT